MKNIPRDTIDNLFLKKADFVMGVADVNGLPEPFMPEIAFIGRSNAGKSSLINALTLKKDLARVSNTPGRTRQLNFFRMADRFLLVDMPGYGFAKANQNEMAGWHALIEAYLKARPTLKRLCLLIDSRHGPKANDSAFMETLKAHAVPFVAVLTKTDKIKASECKDVKAQTENALLPYGAAWPEAFLTSAEKKDGLDTLRQFLASSILD